MSLPDCEIVRFRADPSRVRIGVRHNQSGWWSVSITSRKERDAHPRILVNNKSPRKALVIALHMAEERALPGVDMSMGSAYYHPQAPRS